MKINNSQSFVKLSSNKKYSRIEGLKIIKVKLPY